MNYDEFKKAVKYFHEHGADLQDIKSDDLKGEQLFNIPIGKVGQVLKLTEKGMEWVDPTPEESKEMRKELLHAETLSGSLIMNTENDL